MVVDLEAVYRDLQQLKIQGATAVAQTIATTLGLYIHQTKKKENYREIKKVADYLLSARPTEAMIHNGVYFMLASLKGLSPDRQEQVLLEKSQVFNQMVKEAKDGLARTGVKVIRKAKTIFTHCHSSSVERVLQKAKEEGNQFRVINTETRPLFQGRITARHLLKFGIPVTMVVDSAGSFFLSSSFPEKIDLLIIGADAILEDGSVINKIGSYGLSLAARQAGVPVYVATSLLKYYPGSEIEIEKRSPKEIWAEAPSKLEIVNLAFDRVPAENITGIITEAGLVKPQDFARKTINFYPWLHDKTI